MDIYPGVWQQSHAATSRQYTGYWLQKLEHERTLLNDGKHPPVNIDAAKRSTQTPPRSQRNWRVVQQWMFVEANAEMLDGMEFGFEKGTLTRPLYKPRKAIPQYASGRNTIPATITIMPILCILFLGNCLARDSHNQCRRWIFIPEFGNSSILPRVESTPIRVAMRTRERLIE
ncbi:hypothetical protein CEXT_489971 [Caerostris extrusa]|uniref:Uncharacterized protein n=1 Tax=Caerostris extrusa TaxID=172846 RepID=A0AAV4Y1A6_CAEEX|nr:hypothetical protein CEXT_489971 [Caerostris extrusa]